MHFSPLKASGERMDGEQAHTRASVRVHALACEQKVCSAQPSPQKPLSSRAKSSSLIMVIELVTYTRLRNKIRAAVVAASFTPRCKHPFIAATFRGFVGRRKILSEYRLTRANEASLRPYQA